MVEHEICREINLESMPLDGVEVRKSPGCGGVEDAAIAGHTGNEVSSHLESVRTGGFQRHRWGKLSVGFRGLQAEVENDEFGRPERCHSNLKDQSTVIEVVLGHG